MYHLLSMDHMRHEFQSAPPTGVRGDFRIRGDTASDATVSIRSPHRSEGRFVSRDATALTVSIRSPHRS